ncbi:MAG: phosphoglucomutase [Treponema sp.]
MKNAQIIVSEILEKTANEMILSPSGWRGLFSIENSEESSSEYLAPSYEVLTAIAAKVFLSFLKSHYPNVKKIVLARDGRPTGKAIEETAFHALKDASIKTVVLGIAPIPETMSFARDEDAAFFYISASHNPIGYNGFKFGIGSEGVLPSNEAGLLIQSFKEAIKTPPASLFDDVMEEEAEVKSRLYKKVSFSSYFDNAMQVVSLASSKAEALSFFKCCRKEVSALQKESPIYVVCDFNGSARAASIDRRFFKKLGIEFLPFHDVAGKIAHGIIPEGENLSSVCRMLEALYEIKGGRGIFLGYMPDCDGDRGNVVYIDGGVAKILKSQQVFALAVVAEVLHAKLDGKDDLAVVANGPTSMLLDELSSLLSFKLVRSEVGEANVVALANEMTGEGFVTRVLGEGSNGGCIIPPSLVRDPMNTLFALLKFFLVKYDGLSLFNHWLKARNEKVCEHFSFSDIVASLPCYSTTPVASERAILRCKIEDYKAFRTAFQKVFLSEWQGKCEDLKKSYGILSYRAFGYVGKETVELTYDFSLTDRGGFKIIFYGENDERKAFIWMRASGTEPVFRIMADVKDAGEDDEIAFVEWEKKMILSSLASV